ncbi:hypothetical protein, partial [Gordonia sp. (in: high G+C Gram-positive bacteria)]|uniref:hypothetical protein n=1 Tax=Gordonia sp. (in: high G+C Gram-positive bacteria) TaxID=84139 RepID=UPI003F9E1CE4
SRPVAYDGSRLRSINVAGGFAYSLTAGRGPILLVERSRDSLAYDGSRLRSINVAGGFAL